MRKRTVKIVSSPYEHEYQLVKRGDDPKNLNQSNILLSNLALKNNVFQAFLYRMQAYHQTQCQINDHTWLALVPRLLSEFQLQQLKTKLWDTASLTTDFCYDPLIHHPQYGIYYDATQDHDLFSDYDDEIGDFNQDQAIPIDDIVTELLQHYVNDRPINIMQIKSKRTYCIKQQLLVLHTLTNVQALPQLLAVLEGYDSHEA